MKDKINSIMAEPWGQRLSQERVWSVGGSEQSPEQLNNSEELKDAKNVRIMQSTKNHGKMLVHHTLNILISQSFPCFLCFPLSCIFTNVLFLPSHLLPLMIFLTPQNFPLFSSLKQTNFMLLLYILFFFFLPQSWHFSYYLVNLILVWIHRRWFWRVSVFCFYLSITNI